MKKPALEKYDSNEFNKLTEYYKNQFTEDYQGLSDSAAKINLHSNFITIHESLSKKHEKNLKLAQNEIKSMLRYFTDNGLRDNEILEQADRLINEFQMKPWHGAGIIKYLPDNSQSNKVFNRILKLVRSLGRRFYLYQGIEHQLAEVDNQLNEIIKPYRIRSFVIDIESFYQDYFKIGGRLYPTRDIVDILNLNGYEYEINTGEDFKETDSIKMTKEKNKQLNTGTPEFWDYVEELLSKIPEGYNGDKLKKVYKKLDKEWDKYGIYGYNSFKSFKASFYKAGRSVDVN